MEMERKELSFVMLQVKISLHSGKSSLVPRFLPSLVPRPSRGGEKKAWCTLFAHACN